MKKVEQQQVIETPEGFFIATVEVTLARREVVDTRILSRDEGPFETRADADTAFEQ